MSSVTGVVRGLAKASLRDESVMSLLLIALFAAQTFQDTFSQNQAFHLSVVEIVAVLCLAIWILVAGRLELPQSRSSRFVLFLLGLWALLGLGLWIISGDWAYDLNEARWLWITLGVAVFLSYAAEANWARMVAIFVGVTFVSALVADFQGLTGAFVPPFASLPPKEFFLAPTTLGAQSLAVGFYQHPNAFGAQVFWPLLICVGFAFKRKRRWLALLGVAFFGASLYLSFYRTLLVGFLFSVVLLAMIQLRLRPWVFAVAAGAMSVVGMGGSVALALFAKGGRFLGDLSGRGVYWVDAFRLIRNQPMILLFGSGFRPSAELVQAQARSDPHDMYLYMLMHYGILGLVLLIVLIATVVEAGWRGYRRGQLDREPVLGAIWAGFIAWFATGSIDSRLTTAGWQVLFVAMMFLLLGGLFVQAEQRKAMPVDKKPAECTKGE